MIDAAGVDGKLWLSKMDPLNPPAGMDNFSRHGASSDVRRPLTRAQQAARDKRDMRTLLNGVLMPRGKRTRARFLGSHGQRLIMMPVADAQLKIDWRLTGKAQRRFGTTIASLSAVLTADRLAKLQLALSPRGLKALRRGKNLHVVTTGTMSSPALGQIKMSRRFTLR